MREIASPNIEEAKDFLRGKEGSPSELLKLAKKLKGENAFKYARSILALASRMNDKDLDKAERIELVQQHALCIYKDPDLPTNERLGQALEILKEGTRKLGDPLSKTSNQETLGIAGAIHKRMWEYDGQKEHLERSLGFYYRGFKYFEQGDTSDFGYTGINAAFVFELLADQDEETEMEVGTDLRSTDYRNEEARRIRETLVHALPPLLEEPGKKWLEDAWWFLVTIAEAYFGLEKYEEASVWLNKAMKLRKRLLQEKKNALDTCGDDAAAWKAAYNLPFVSDWEYASTARQLAKLAHLMVDKSAFDKSKDNIEEAESWKTLKEFLQGNSDALRTIYAGKMGLALSGGGFRASLFHIGVLAKLAELDMLRHIETLSCVSGGSIIGAHYYLEVRRLLETKEDSKIDREDYIKIVKRIIKTFPAGVKRNLRTRIAAEITTNLKMVFQQGYSRTQRLGELYEEEIFSQCEGCSDKKLWLSGLHVKPMGKTGQNINQFRPKYDNWLRHNKVPVLILNSTTLNTGHNWQFTASWMGESPYTIDTEIDGNYRLRRMYYEEAPKQHQQMRLGYAVAASSCVPGLFEPFTMDKLYPDINVQLVDGGVHDNQGVVGLLEQDCQVFLVSDASGQMGAVDNPGQGILGVPLRTNSILMARVRDAEYQDLKARRLSSLLRGLMFIHLQKDLHADPIDWIDSDETFDAADAGRPDRFKGPLTRYGIRKDVQKQLSAIRTDLDSFNDAEAFALMTSGYRMAEFEIPQQIKGFPTPKEDCSVDWKFLRVEPSMKQKAGSEKLTALLEVANSGAFKIWKLSKSLRIISFVIGLLALAAFFWACWAWSTLPIMTLGWIGAITGFVLAGVIFGKMVARVLWIRNTLIRVAIGIFMATLGWLGARLHLHVFDKWYLRRGRIDHVVPPED